MITRDEFLVHPGGLSTKVQVKRRTVREVSKRDRQKTFTDPKTKREHLLPKKVTYVTTMKIGA